MVIIRRRRFSFLHFYLFWFFVSPLSNVYGHFFSILLLLICLKRWCKHMWTLHSIIFIYFFIYSLILYFRCIVIVCSQLQYNISARTRRQRALELQWAGRSTPCYLHLCTGYGGTQTENNGNVWSRTQMVQLFT